LYFFVYIKYLMFSLLVHEMTDLSHHVKYLQMLLIVFNNIIIVTLIVLSIFDCRPKKVSEAKMVTVCASKIQYCSPKEVTSPGSK